MMVSYSACSSAWQCQKPDAAVSPGARAFIIHVVCMHMHVYVYVRRYIHVCIIAYGYPVLMIINYRATPARSPGRAVAAPSFERTYGK